MEMEMDMDINEVLHMNKGLGETSYAQNSIVQKKIISMGKQFIDEAILEGLSQTIKLPESLGIADLGCSSGPNTLLPITHIMDTTKSKYNSLGLKSPEFRLFLNDLYSNDFNNILLSLPEFFKKIKEQDKERKCFVFAVPGSFYGRLFPTNTLHFVHSSSSIHWLSQDGHKASIINKYSHEIHKVPEGVGTKNKGKVYISKRSPRTVLDAYLNQFKEDFSVFLNSRSDEMVANGRMVLSFMGRTTSDPTTAESCYQWELLAHALMSLASEGLIEEEKVNTFNAPYYAPSTDEIKEEIEKQGSFILDKLEAFEIKWDEGSGYDHREIVNNSVDTQSIARGIRVAKTIRAVVESMLASHFGDHIMDCLFIRYGEIVANYLANNQAKYINLVLSLTKKAIY